VIEETRPEQWQRRAAALTELVAQIPGGSEYNRRDAWYNSPPMLRHLHQPIGELLKDPRSTVVKRTCEALGQIFARCQGDAKYLFKDLMPVVLNVHAQTVQVIRSQVQSMILEAIPVVPCKMVMPLWLERLKTDKSRTVREACVLYLGFAIKHWSSNENNAEGGTAYLTEENWVQIGSAFINTLRDPSPAVRAYAKSGIATIRDNQPDLWYDLIRDPDGPAGKDIKLQKWLIKVSENGEEFNATSNEELSVASRFSHYSHASKNRLTAPPTPGSRSAGGFNSSRPLSQGRAAAVPVQINVNSKAQQPPRQMRGLGPPLRRPFAQATDTTAQSPGRNTSSNSGNTATQLGTPPRPPIGASSPSRQRSPSPSLRRNDPRHALPQRSRSTSSAEPFTPTTLVVDEDNRSFNASRGRVPPTPEAMNGKGGNHRVIGSVDDEVPQQHLQVSQDPEHVTKSIDQTLAHLEMPGEMRSQPGAVATEEEEEGPFIASMNELKQHASERRSRRSIMLQERWSRADSLGGKNVMGSPSPMAAIPGTPAEDGTYNTSTTIVPSGAPNALPEHYAIAEQLLRVHKTHVDQIMETLKIEMDTLRDFEQSMESEQTITPDQVLDYFESVGLCLDQRTTAGNIMQREMDRISKGAFQNNNVAGSHEGR